MITRLLTMNTEKKVPDFHPSFFRFISGILLFLCLTFFASLTAISGPPPELTKYLLELCAFYLLGSIMFGAITRVWWSPVFIGWLPVLVCLEYTLSFRYPDNPLIDLYITLVALFIIPVTMSLLGGFIGSFLVKRFLKLHSDEKADTKSD